MAASSSSSTLFLLLATAFSAIIGITAAATAAAPSAASSTNLTDILTKGGQYNTFLRLLRSTQVGEQIQSQLNNSFNGLTVFAPTDNAFNNLKAGTLNALSTQDQVDLVLSHVLPRFYSLSTFQTASNPLATQASGPGGVYTVNVSSTTNQLNVTTGVVETQVNNPLETNFPLAVYSVDKVLLPSELFGPKPPEAAPVAAAPAKSPSKEKPAKGGTAAETVAEAPSDAANHPSAAARLMAGAAVVGILGIVSIL